MTGVPLVRWRNSRGELTRWHAEQAPGKLLTKCAILPPPEARSIRRRLAWPGIVPRHMCADCARKAGL